jgi:hypothetical protein
MVEKKTAIGREMGRKVKARFPIIPAMKKKEMSRVARSSVSRKSWNVMRKLMKKTVLTVNGIIN